MVRTNTNRMKISNRRAKRLKRVQKKLFSKVNLHKLKVFYWNNGELESIYRAMVTRIYIQEINDTLNKMATY